jgi:5-methylcytosine-specific restriction endonuclease McrA
VSTRNKVYVEIGEDKLPIRLIKNHAEVWRLPPDKVAHWPKGDAVRAIRQKAVDRAKGECEFCGCRVVWQRGDLHEVVFRSQGGEVSVANSVYICAKCHRNEHGEKVK